MKKPTGKEILSLLIDLLAKQENVKVEYEIIEREGGEKIETDTEELLLEESE